ncbi:MAG: hypothetical protein M3136_03480 [Thermoproteota archaeon]|nr:hypothetical protein [Thermoproteota archaeon]
MSTDEKHGILTKIEKGIERAADEYASNPAISLAFSSIPGIGPIIDNMLHATAGEIQKRRYLKLWTGLKAEVALVDETKIDKSFFESEEFYDLIRKTFYTALETANSDKIRLYARILVHSVLLDNAKFRYHAKDFLSLLLGLLPADLVVAREIYKQQKDTPTDIQPEVMSEVQIVRNSGFYEVRELTGLDKAEFDLALTKLVRAGLVRQVVGSYIGYAGDAYRITHTFRKMMDLVEDPEYLK